MAQIGQTTTSGGRTFLIYDEQGAMRRMVLPVAATLNHVGIFCWEATVANQNNLKATIYNTSGVKVAETNIRTAAIPGIGVGNVSAVTMPFAGGVSLPAGTYDVMVCATVGSSTVGINGQNGAGGTPVSMFFSYIYPTAPDPYTGLVDTTATRAWDIYLDYTAATVPTVTSLTPASPVRIGQVGVVIAGTNFGVTQSSGHVVISPSNDVNDVNAVSQTVTSWGDTSVTINVVRNTLSLATNLYLFVVNDGGSSNASGSVVQILPSIGALALGAGLFN